jgi:hypothetical protein
MIGWSKMTEKLLDMTLKEMLFRCLCITNKKKFKNDIKKRFKQDTTNFN